MQNETTPAELKNGPIVDRSCTDLICLILFILFGVGSFGIFTFAIKSGDPAKLVQAYDPDHRACGVSQGVEDFKYIYFVNPMSPQYLYATTCVKTCPTQNSGQQPTETQINNQPAHYEQINEEFENNKNFKHLTVLECATNSVVDQCGSRFDILHPEKSIIIYQSAPYMNRICLPIREDFFKNAAAQSGIKDYAQNFEDIKKSNQVILGSLLIAIIVSFLFIYLIEKCAGVIVWLFILLVLTLLASGAFIFYNQYKIYSPIYKPSENSSTMTKDFNAKQVDPNYYLYAAYTLAALDATIFLIVICSFNRIRLAIAILKTASDFVEDNFSVIFMPFITTILLLFYLAFWITVALYLYSSGAISQRPHQLPFGQLEFTDAQRLMGHYWFFGLFWYCCFLMAAIEFIICGAVCIWYFQQGPGGQKSFSPLATSFFRFWRYHIGTVAFGSLLVALVVFCRFWLEYLYHNSEELRKRNKLLEYIMMCLRCYLLCFEKCVQYIDRNAYICTNMTGKSFCPAAVDAIGVILRNPARFSVVGGLGAVFVAIGRIFICLMTGFICYMIIINSSLKLQIIQPAIPAFLCALVGLVIGSNFMSVYGKTCDTILFVFCMDEELEKSTKKPLQCPPGLKDFMDNN